MFHKESGKCVDEYLKNIWMLLAIPRLGERKQVVVPCLGAVLSIDWTIKYSRPKKSCFDVPGITPSVFTPPVSKVY